MISRTPKILPYKYIIFLAMLFITIDLAAVSVAYKIVSLNYLYEINSAATFIFPITYALGDIVTEVYGYNLARKLIWFSLLLQFLFAVLVTCAIHLPSPEFWLHDSAYHLVFGSIIRFVLAGTVANLVSSFANIYLVSKLKIPFEGRLFWFRSILSNLVSGFFMVVIIIVMGFSGHTMNLSKSLVMFKSTYSLEITYALLLVIPVSWITYYLKKAEKVDVYDDHTNYNPFVFFNDTSGSKI